MVRTKALIRKASSVHFEEIRSPSVKFTVEAFLRESTCLLIKLGDAVTTVTNYAS
jgi:hypothetical protein